MKWPLAIDESLIPCCIEDKAYRGQAIVELLINQDIEGNFLDFGCGEGFAAKYASKYATLSVGYDPTPQWSSDPLPPNCLLTKDYAQVSLHKPYQTILMFDVLNHTTDPATVLKTARNLLDNQSRLYVRTHPWQSRHATHEASNSAYLHLYKKIESDHSTLDIKDELFEHCGLSIIKKREIHEEIEPFFSSLKEKLLDETSKPNTLQYVDYILTKKRKLL